MKNQTVNTEVEDRFISLDLNTEEDIKTIEIKVQNFLEKILSIEKEEDLAKK